MKFSHRCSGMWMRGGNKIQCDKVLGMDSVEELRVRRSEVTSMTKEGTDVGFQGSDRMAVYICQSCGSQTVSHSIMEDRFEEMKEIFLTTSTD